MATTIDHLQNDHWVHVLKGFHDARGNRHEEGESGLIRSQKFDGSSREIQIEWERGGVRETMYFLLADKTGPGNGRMKEYFQLGRYDPPERPGFRFIPELGYFTSSAPELPPLPGELIRDESRADEALQRVWALAGRKRFEEALEQLLAITGDWRQFAAEKLGAAAQLHVADVDGEVYEWLRDRSIDHWYSWGSGATSGGEGACRLLEMKPAIERFAILDRYRQTLSGSETKHRSE